MDVEPLPPIVVEDHLEYELKDSIACTSRSFSVHQLYLQHQSPRIVALVLQHSVKLTYTLAPSRPLQDKGGYRENKHQNQDYVSNPLTIRITTIV